MKNIWTVFLCGALIVIPLCRVHATTNSLIISEIMYDLEGSDTDHEWIEIYNASSEDVKIIGGSGEGSYRFNDGSNHVLADTPAHGSMNIPAGTYAILAANADIFLSDHPDFSGTVIDTSMSLKNDGDTISLINGFGNTLSSVSYTSTQGAAGDGMSLALSSSGSWSAGSPTPGSGPLENIASTEGAVSSTSSDANNSTSISSTGSIQSNSTHRVIAPEAKITGPLKGVTGVPLHFSTSVWGSDARVRTSGFFHITFGDGTDAESKTPIDTTHTYAYAGSYRLYFEYRSNPYGDDEPLVSIEQTIEVRDSQVIISEIGKDGSIQLKNTGTSEADISKWRVVSLDNGNAPFFVFPTGTRLLAGTSVRLAKSLNYFGVNIHSVGLLLPSGVAVDVYQVTDLSPKFPLVLSTEQDIPVVTPLPIVDSDIPTKITQQHSWHRSLGIYLVGLFVIISTVVYASLS